MALYEFGRIGILVVKLLKYGSIVPNMTRRSLTTIEVTKNISLISHDKKNKIVQNMKLSHDPQKPLVVMLTWLMARKKHVSKYADFYLKRGFDVMTISVSPWQLLWPIKGTQIVAADIVKFLDKNHSYGPLVVHGFSIGGYLWAEAMVQMAADHNRHQHIINRINGQIWDSLADVTEIPEGLPVAVFPRNKVLQNALKQYIIYHLKTFDKVATCHYIRASQMFHTNIIRAPALFFVSKSDTIGAETSNRRAKENWDNMGITTYWKMWDNTPHVGHFRHYPEEYIAELVKFLENIGLAADEVPREKLQAKL